MHARQVLLVATLPTLEILSRRAVSHRSPTVRARSFARNPDLALKLHSRGNAIRRHAETPLWQAQEQVLTCIVPPRTRHVEVAMLAPEHCESSLELRGPYLRVRKLTFTNRTAIRLHGSSLSPGPISCQRTT